MGLKRNKAWIIGLVSLLGITGMGCTFNLMHESPGDMVNQMERTCLKEVNEKNEEAMKHYADQYIMCAKKEEIEYLLRMLRDPKIQDDYKLMILDAIDEHRQKVDLEKVMQLFLEEPLSQEVLEKLGEILRHQDGRDNEQLFIKEMQGETLQTEAFWEGFKRYDQYKIGAVGEIYQLDIRSKGLIEAYVKDIISAQVFNQFAGNEAENEVVYEWKQLLIDKLEKKEFDELDSLMSKMAGTSLSEQAKALLGEFNQVIESIHQLESLTPKEHNLAIQKTEDLIQKLFFVHVSLDEMKVDETAEEKEAEVKVDEQSTQLTQSQAESQKITYDTYLNERYVFSIDYPDYLLKGEAPTNGDGITLSSDEKQMCVIVSGSNNVCEDTVDSEYDYYMSSISGVAYKKKSGNSFILSWLQDGMIYYMKEVVGAGSMNTLIICYPASSKEEMDEVVTRISNSFTTPGINECW